MRENLKPWQRKKVVLFKIPNFYYLLQNLLFILNL